MEHENISFISEMINNEPLNVEFSSGVDVNSIIAQVKDDEPMFVTLEALNEGESKNGRYYSRETIYQIAEQVNKLKPVAYEGHLDPKDRPYKRPRPITIWLGAKVVDDNGKARLFIKGYVYPSAKDLREYLKIAKAVGKNVAVSIYGQAREIMNKAKRVKEVIDMSLESIDWTRDLAEGVSTKGFLAITAEMRHDDKQEVLESFDALKKQVANEVLKKEGMQFSVISEMLGVEPTEVADKLTVILEQYDNMKTEIQEMKVDNILRERVGNRSARKAIKSLVVAEMKSVDYNSEVVSEMVDRVLNTGEAKALIAEHRPFYEINPLSDNSTNVEDTRKFTQKK